MVFDGDKIKFKDMREYLEARKLEWAKENRQGGQGKKILNTRLTRKIEPEKRQVTEEKRPPSTRGDNFSDDDRWDGGDID